MKNKTVNALIALGVPADVKGFKYIVYAIEILDNPESNEIKQGKLYEKIAEIYSDTVSRVERSMRFAFSCAFRFGNKEIIDKYLTNINKNNGNLLHVLYWRLKQEE